MIRTAMRTFVPFRRYVPLNLKKGYFKSKMNTFLHIRFSIAKELSISSENFLLELKSFKESNDLNSNIGSCALLELFPLNLKNGCYLSQK